MFSYPKAAQNAEKGQHFKEEGQDKKVPSEKGKQNLEVTQKPEVKLSKEIRVGYLEYKRNSVKRK